MKTNPSLKIFKPSTLVSLGIAIAAALLTQPARATAINTLVITEFSSTSLTALLNGTTSLNVTPGVADVWTIDLAGVGFHLNGPMQQLWTEPDAAGEVNVVHVVFDNNLQPTGQITVFSDLGNGLSGLADGTPDTTTFTFNGGELDVTFVDKGDVATAPDTGTTLGLLSLSVVALLGATRLRFLQLAA